MPPYVYRQARQIKGGGTLSIDWEMVWRIEAYDSNTLISETVIPLNNASEAKISELLKSLASQHLSPEEIAAGLADVSKDDAHGNRIILTAGQNPHYIAGLFRSDELPAKE